MVTNEASAVKNHRPAMALPKEGIAADACAGSPKPKHAEPNATMGV